MTEPAYRTMIEPWESEEQGEVARTNIFTVRRRRCVSRMTPGKGGSFVYLDCPDWCNIVAVTPDDEVVLIEQFRYGTLEVTLELPGGMLDPGEDPVTAGVRELREETGFAGRDARSIGRVSSNPAMMNNRTHTILVEACERVGEQRLEGSEEIAVRLVPVSDLGGLIAEGTIDHTLVVSAITHYLLRRGELCGGA